MERWSGGVVERWSGGTSPHEPELAQASHHSLSWPTSVSSIAPNTAKSTLCFHGFHGLQTCRCKAVAASEEGGDKSMSHLRQPEAEKKSNQRQAPRSRTAKPNPTTRNPEPEPAVQKHEAVAASEEEGDGDKSMSHLRQPEAEKKSNQRQAPRSRTAKPNPTTRNPRTYNAKAWHITMRPRHPEAHGGEARPGQSDHMPRPGENEIQHNVYVYYIYIMLSIYIHI